MMKAKVLSGILRQGVLGVPPELLWSYRRIGLDERELVLILVLMALGQQDRDYYPDLGDLSLRLDIPVPELQAAIASLAEKRCLDIVQEYLPEEGKRRPVFSLDPLMERVGEAMVRREEEFRSRLQEQKQEKLKERDPVYTVFEKEFGRLLSPMETGYLREWLDGDHYSEELVFEALRSAVSRDKLNFKYIDTILRSWEKKGIRSARAAREEEQSFGKKKPAVRRREPAPDRGSGDGDTPDAGKSGYDDLVMN